MGDVIVIREEDADGKSDGSERRYLAAETIIIHTDIGVPRELKVMEQAHNSLRALDPDEARRVVAWLCEMFPEQIKAEARYAD